MRYSLADTRLGWILTNHNTVPAPLCLWWNIVFHVGLWLWRRWPAEYVEILYWYDLFYSQLIRRLIIIYIGFIIVFHSFSHYFTIGSPYRLRWNLNIVIWGFLWILSECLVERTTLQFLQYLVLWHDQLWSLNFLLIFVSCDTSICTSSCFGRYVNFGIRFFLPHA